MYNQTLSSNLIQSLVCPKCKGQLEFFNGSIQCIPCSTNFPQVTDKWIDLLPNQQIDETVSQWQERLTEMEDWYNDLITNPKSASDCLIADYIPYASFLSSLSGDILDVGGGIGIPRNYLPSNTRYIVLDPSLEWLKTDWTPLANAFPCIRKNPDFVRGIGEALPFPSASFDAVLSFWSLNHTNNPEAVFGEVARVLRPNGRFLVVLEEMAPQWFDLINPKFPAKKIFDSFFNLDLLPQQFPRIKLSLNLLKQNEWPLQTDHIRIQESEIQTWITGIFKIKRRVWVNQYLTFELIKR